MAQSPLHLKSEDAVWWWRGRGKQRRWWREARLGHGLALVRKFCTGLSRAFWHCLLRSLFTLLFRNLAKSQECKARGNRRPHVWCQRRFLFQLTAAIGVIWQFSAALKAVSNASLTKIPLASDPALVPAAYLPCLRTMQQGVVRC
jgi:hypothetical protein